MHFSICIVFVLYCSNVPCIWVMVGRGDCGQKGRFEDNTTGMSEIVHECVEILRPLMQCQGYKHPNSRFESDACRRKNNG